MRFTVAWKENYTPPVAETGGSSGVVDSIRNFSFR
jgi:hypothetical protein